MARSAIIFFPLVLQVAMTVALPLIPVSIMEKVLCELAAAVSLKVTLP